MAIITFYVLLAVRGDVYYSPSSILTVTLHGS